MEFTRHYCYNDGEIYAVFFYMFGVFINNFVVIRGLSYTMEACKRNFFSVGMRVALLMRIICRLYRHGYELRGCIRE